MTSDKISSGGPLSLEAHMTKDSEISCLISQLASQPHQFHEPNKTTSERTLKLVQALYDKTKAQELPYRLVPRNIVRSKAHGFGLDNLIVNGFDNDQLWQQLDLRNKPFLERRAQPLLDELLGSADSLSEEEQDGEDQQIPLSDLSGESEAEISGEEDSESAVEEEEADVAIEDVSDEAEDNSEENDSEEEEVEVGDDDVFSEEERTEVDDEFFSLNRMHKMVEKLEEEEFNPPEEKDSDDESIDLQMDLDDLGSDDDIPADEMKFSDFFKGVSKGKGNSNGAPRKVSFAPAPKADLFGEDSEDEESDGEKPTKFEKKQATMSKMIEQLEEENVSAKPWTMMGEAAAWNRPKDSLLEEDLEFDHASKPVPVVTVEVTQTLEQMIKQRILDQNFNDVVKPAKENLKPRFNSDEVELDTEKAKQSLAQVYEDEYRKATSQPGQSDDIPPEVRQSHEEIDALFQSICFKLDALANCHYAPKMPKIEVQVVRDLPAIAIEEKIPVAVSDATLLAPEEVFAQAHHGQAGRIEPSAELSQEERNRIRNRKKRLAKLHRKNADPKPSTVQS